MKKTLFCIMSIVLCLMIAITAMAKTYTLPERMGEQLDWGSGLKGVINANFEGNGEVAQLFSGLNGRKISIRGITDKNQQTLYYAYETDPEDKEHLMGLTQVYGKENDWFLNSELLGNRVYELTALKDGTTDGRDVTPSLLPIIAQLMMSGSETIGNEWDIMLKNCELQMETWLAGFAGIPNVEKLDDGDSIMTFSYTIPGEAVTDEVCAVAEMLLRNTDITAPVTALLTEEQSDVYLNSALIDYYREVMKSLRINEPVKMLREVTTKGEELRSEIELPLPEENPTGFNKVTISTENNLTVYRFAGMNTEWAFGCRILKNSEEEASYEGVLSREYTETEKKSFAVRWHADMNRKADEDAEGMKTDDIIWTISTEYAPEIIPESDKADLYDKEFSTALTIKMNYSGQNANSSPTTLKIDIEGNIGDTSLNIDSTFKTSGSWVIVPFETDKAVPFGKYMNDHNGRVLETLIKTLCGTVIAENQ